MIAIIQRGLANVADYYRTFSYDVAWNDTISIDPAAVHSVAFTTFADLLDAIVARAAGGERDFLLGCHGNPNGLPLPLHRGTQVTTNHDILDNMTSAIGGSVSDRRDLLNFVDDRRRKIFANERQLDDLLGRLTAVRNLGLRNLHFRACNLGDGPALAAVHRALGVSHTEGPKVFFVWSNIATARVHATPDQLQQQIRRLGFPQRVYTRVECLISRTGTDSGDPAVAMSVTVRADGRADHLEFRALGAEAIEGWTNSFLYSTAYWACGTRPAGGGYRRGGQLPIIGLLNTNQGAFPVFFPGDGYSYLQNIEVVNS